MGLPIQSMTGYGEHKHESDELYLHVSLKTTNNKYLDVDAHLPRAFASQEVAWRKSFAKVLHRGRVHLHLTFQWRAIEPEKILQKDVLLTYASFLKTMCHDLGISGDILTNTMRLPGAIRSESLLLHDLSEAHRNMASATVAEALKRCFESRVTEGNALVAQLNQCLTHFMHNFTQIDQHVAEQQKILRQRLQERLSKEEFTPQAWEQEMINVLSKASIEEEKVRIQSHLNFFQETLQQGGPVGKKITFILQEISREVNTIGAKAQYGPLQHLAVNMKEVLEQMREQIVNVV